MSKIPTTTNETANAVNKAISITGNTIVEVVESAIIADVPFLGLPIIKQLWEALFHWIANYFIQAAKQGATFAIIDAQVDAEIDELSKKLLSLTEAQKSGDSDAFKKALKAYANAHSDLAHADGSASIE